MVLVASPNGPLNLSTSDGCVAFLRLAPEGISKNAEGLEQRSVDQRAEKYAIFGYLGCYLPDEHRKAVPKPQKQVLVNLCKKGCDKAKASSEWQRTGTLSQDSMGLLKCILPWTVESQFCQLMLEGGPNSGLGKIAALCESSAKPGPEFLRSMFSISANCLVNSPSGVKPLDATGVLAQLFRTAKFAGASSPTKHPGLAEVAVQVVKLVQQDPRFVRKHLGKDSIAGIALRKACNSTPTAAAAAAAASAGKGKSSGGGGGRMLATVAEALHVLEQQASLSQGEAMAGIHLRMCRGCSKEATPGGPTLLKCGKCKAAFYCNRECQMADWKRHKKECRSPKENSSGYGEEGGEHNKRNVDNSSTTNSAMGFVHTHIKQVRDRLRAAAAATATEDDGTTTSLSSSSVVAKKKLTDLSVVIDFQGGALEGDFVVLATDKLIRREWLPSFCYDDDKQPRQSSGSGEGGGKKSGAKGDGSGGGGGGGGNGRVMEDNVSALLAQVAATQATLMPNMLLVVVRSLSGGCAICRAQNRAADGTPLFSDDLLAMSEAQYWAEDRRLNEVAARWAFENPGK